MVSADSPSVALTAALEHRFTDPVLLEKALTHSSVSGTGRTGAEGTYERLEFLGDRVLGLVIAEWLLSHYPRDREGALAKRLAALVRRETLAEVAQAIRLGPCLRLSPGEEDSGGRANPTILADACEAVIGALYLDAGLETARRFIRRYWAPFLEGRSPPPFEPKTSLQEWAQARGKPLPVYRVVSQTGPDHAPHFAVEVAVDGLPCAVGTGSSKRVAERQAAAALLHRVAGGPESSAS